MVKARHEKPPNGRWLWLVLALVLIVVGVPYLIGVGESYTAAPAPEVRPQCTATVCVNLVQRKMWAQAPDGDSLYGPVSLSAGAATGDKATPVGLFQVVEKRNDDRLRPFEVVFTNDGYSFHEGSVIGTTQGSINLDLPSAKWLYDTIRIGDTVQIF